MKYIDADLLRKEIEKERKSIEGLFIEGDDNFYDGQDDAYNHTLALIDSLQQEQQDFPTTDEQMKEFLATNPKIKVPEKYKNPDWLFKKQEQQEADLEDKVTFDCISKKVTMTVRELINYYIDRECCDVADECGF